MALRYYPLRALPLTTGRDRRDLRRFCKIWRDPNDSTCPNLTRDVVVLQPPLAEKNASVDTVDESTVKWQSEVEKAPQSSSATDFWDVLHSYEN